MVAKNAIIAALSSTALISLAPNVLLFLFPFYASGEGQQSSLLSLGQAMAAGGLLGDVFLHTIPHTSSGEDMGLWLLFGFSLFLTADMILRSFGNKHSHSHDKGKQSNHEHLETRRSAVLLNLAADAMHNFTDGLAIGASFAISSDASSVLSLLKSRGGLATISIMFHEIPHELGDFAVLVKNGFSYRQAIFAQFGTAIAAMIGTGVGIVLEEFVGEVLIYITAGGFIYLAATTIIPELLEEETSIRMRFAQLSFFAAGIGFMYAVSLLEAMDSGHSGHSHSHSHDGPTGESLKAHEHNHGHSHGHSHHGHSEL